MTAKKISFNFLILLMLIAGLKVNTKEYESPLYLEYVAEVTSSFLKEMYKEYGFECGASGGEMPYDVEEISVSLVIDQSATIEQAREWEIKTTERFVQVINAHEKIRPFLREYPFPSSRARVSIRFITPKKQKKSLPADDDVRRVFQVRNKIFYRGKNPDNPYVARPIKDEPYEEALKVVQDNAAKKTLPKDL
jgi:hypothetical protein